MVSSSLALALVTMAACGGKIASSETGPNVVGPEQNACSKTVPTCSGNCEEDYAAKPSCIDGSWVCPFPADHCKPPIMECSPAAEPDCKCGSPKCVTGVWECPRSCGCPADLAGAVGTSCDQEGESCGGSACTNSCEFCNIIQCSAGVWTQLEVFPDPNCGDAMIAVDAGFAD